ncbi:MAG: hypothetical protein ACPGR7_01590 [Flavobacteriaceae bacterium]
MQSTLSKEQHDYSIRIMYSSSALSVPLIMGAVFFSWGLYNFSGDLFDLKNWPIHFGIFYMLSYIYMKVFGFMLVNNNFFKKLDLFQRKTDWSEIRLCKKYSKDFILKTDHKDIYISAGLVDKKSLTFLLKFIKEKGIAIE